LEKTYAKASRAWKPYVNLALNIAGEMSMTVETAFAPAERATAEDVWRQHEKLARLPYVHDFLAAIPTLSVVLNTQRQVVFANRAFAEFLNANRANKVWEGDSDETFDRICEDMIGKRPGEVIGCTRAPPTEGGCGTGQFCRTCGAVISIMNSQKQHKLNVQECRMLCRGAGGEQTALDLRVWSRPIDVEGETFTVFSIMDISDEKRRKVLERIFFHDVLNTAGEVKGLADLLVKTGFSETECKEIADIISESSSQLIDEINAQRTVSEAESGDLKVSVEEIHSLELMARIIRQFHSFRCASGKILEVDEAAEQFNFRSDPVLICRVLTNLVKNALEAVPEGQKVTLSCFRADGNVCFTVHDAPVMPPDVQLQMYTRFFSTKGSGHGLGTYSIKLITEKYLQGRVSFVSNREEGTRFTVQYPEEIRSSGGRGEENVD
jgi:K+-sensing histidine kinase KdpD